MKMRDFMYSGCFDAQDGFVGREVSCDEEDGDCKGTKSLIWFLMMLQLMTVLSTLL